MAPSYTFLPRDQDFGLLGMIERAATAIGALDSFISKGFLGVCWHHRARWAGYARALQLQAIEIDEIDVISWACALSIPGRHRPHTLMDPFDAFPAWTAALDDPESRHWREDLPFTPILPPAFSEAPVLLRAIALLGQYAHADSRITAWLALPQLLQRLGLTRSPLPCLVAGDKGCRLRPRDADAIIRRILRDLARQAEDGLAMAITLDAERRRWVTALAGERKPAALRAFAALCLREPLFRPEALARRLGMTVSGAGKLLERAAELGFVQEVTGHGSWRVYLAPDMARRLGFAPPLRGRPPKPPAPPALDPLGAGLAAFDAEMADLARRFPHLATESGEDSE